MQFIYRIQPTRPDMLSAGPTEREAELAGQHFEYLRRLAEQGVVLLAGRTQTTTPDSFGIIIFQAESEAAAQQVVDDDPAVRGGVFRAQLYPYKIAVLSDDLSLPES